MYDVEKVKKPAQLERRALRSRSLYSTIAISNCLLQFTCYYAAAIRRTEIT